MTAATAATQSAARMSMIRSSIPKPLRATARGASGIFWTSAPMTWDIAPLLTRLCARLGS